MVEIEGDCFEFGVFVYFDENVSFFIYCVEEDGFVRL